MINTYEAYLKHEAGNIITMEDALVVLVFYRFI